MTEVLLDGSVEAEVNVRCAKAVSHVGAPTLVARPDALSVRAVVVYGAWAIIVAASRQIVLTMLNFAEEIFGEHHSAQFVQFQVSNINRMI
jgi:hypothetical protein